MIFQAWCELRSCSFIFKSFMHVLCHCKMWIWCLFILHVTHHAFIALRYFWLSSALPFFVAFYMTWALHVLACVVNFTLSFSCIISSSSSGIARNHHAAAAAGAGCSITGDPYHGKHLKPLKMAPIFPPKALL